MILYFTHFFGYIIRWHAANTEVRKFVFSIFVFVFVFEQKYLAQSIKHYGIWIFLYYHKKKISIIENFRILFFFKQIHALWCLEYAWLFWDNLCPKCLMPCSRLTFFLNWCMSCASLHYSNFLGDVLLVEMHWIPWNLKFRWNVT